MRRGAYAYVLRRCHGPAVTETSSSNDTSNISLGDDPPSLHNFFTTAFLLVMRVLSLSMEEL